jgi:hypothetical protein
VQKKDKPKINSYAASKDLEQLSKDDTSEEIIKSIGFGMNGYGNIIYIKMIK